MFLVQSIRVWEWKKRENRYQKKNIHVSEQQKEQKAHTLYPGLKAPDSLFLIYHTWDQTVPQC